MTDYVFDEKAKAEDALANLTLGVNPFGTLITIAKYYTQIEKLNKRKTREILISFLLACDPKAFVPKWERAIDKAVRLASKSPLIDIPYVPVTQAETEVVDSRSTAPERRFAFTLLCLAKYHTLVNPKCEYWVTEESNQIMKLANVNMTVKRQDMAFYNLYKDGYLEYPGTIDRLSCKVLYVDNDAPEVLRVDDFRNLGFQYEAYKGGAFCRCEVCGSLIRAATSAGRPTKYCPDCARVTHAMQRVESNRRMRAEDRLRRLNNIFKSDDKNYPSETA